MKAKIELKGRKRPIFRRGGHLFQDIATDYEQVSKKDRVSQTVPGESYTVQELMERHTRGMLTDVGRDVFMDESANHDSFDLSKIGNLDLYEAEQMAAANKARIDELNASVSERKAKAKAARAQNMLTQIAEMRKADELARTTELEAKQKADRDESADSKGRR